MLSGLEIERKYGIKIGVPDTAPRLGTKRPGSKNKNRGESKKRRKIALASRRKNRK